jgi:ADP-ribose pyrophosphatase
MDLANIISSNYISNHQYFKARKDKYKTSTGKVVEEYFVVEMPNSACAVALTINNEIILVKQYRHPINAMSTEIPGGFIEPNEQLDIAIKRELLEETGYDFDEVIQLGKTYSNPGVLNNATYLFLLKGGRKVALQMLDENEEIDIQLKSIVEVKEMMLNNEFKQSMHELCLLKAFVYLENN